MITLKQLRSIPRLKDIATILVKHGLEQLAESMGLVSLFERVAEIARREAPLGQELSLTLPQRLRSAMQDLGPTFIKLGQILSTRRDILNEEFVDEFARLQDDVSPMGYDRVRSVFQAEMGADPEALFARFDAQPLAAASIGQVHRATLKDGREVVCKVQREGIDHAIRDDLEILYFLARKGESAGVVDRIYDVVGIVDEFAKSIRQELDYVREAQNMNAFRRNFEGDPTVHIPGVILELSTSRILTMEFIHGKKATKFQEIACNPKVLAASGARAILKQVFNDGCFHADPHPGNIVIMENNVICFMDFGMVGRLSQVQRDQISWLLIHLINRDYEALARALVNIGSPLDDIDLDVFATALLDTLDPYFGVTLRQVNLGGLIRSISRLLVRFRLKLPPSYTLMLKSLVTVEGLAKKLDPEFDIMTVARPFVEALVGERWQPRRLAHDMELAAFDAFTFLTRTPHQIARLLQKANQGTLSMEFVHRGLDQLARTLDKASNRLSFALLITAMLLSSSLLLAMRHAHDSAALTGLASAGYIGATFLGIWLGLSILRSGGP